MGKTITQKINCPTCKGKKQIIKECSECEGEGKIEVELKKKAKVYGDPMVILYG